MKKVLCIIFIFLAGCVHLTAAKFEEKKSAAEVEAELTDLLKNLDYGRESESNVFDCSNQAARVYGYLAEHGYQCIIYVGWKFQSGWHAWLSAEKDGKKFLIESTLKKIVVDDRYDDYPVKFRFASLGFLRFLSKTIGLPFGFFYEWD